jgi:pentapeptide MXKDX repeat protein
MKKPITLICAAGITLGMASAYADDMKMDNMGKAEMKKDAMGKGEMSKEATSRDGMKQ